MQSVRSLLVGARILLGIPTDDRRLLGQVLLPAFAAREDLRNVLFVGCDWYTRGYARLFATRRYMTLDVDPAKQAHGSSEHFCGSLASLEDFVAPASLDLVVCNGVFGWGLNERAEVEAAFAASHACLREGGLLVVGWNDVPERRPFALNECAALRRFTPYVLPAVGQSTLTTRTRNRHTYSFFVK